MSQAAKREIVQCTDATHPVFGLKKTCQPNFSTQVWTGPDFPCLPGSQLFILALPEEIGRRPKSYSVAEPLQISRKGCPARDDLSFLFASFFLLLDRTPCQRSLFSLAHGVLVSVVIGSLLIDYRNLHARFPIASDLICRETSLPVTGLQLRRVASRF